MTNTLSTRTTTVRRLAGAALAALVALMTLTLVAPATAHAASATATVSPATAAAGEAVTISGSGFLPGEIIDVWYGGPVIASGVADANGDFSVSGNIPAGMPEGGHPMDVAGSLNSMVSFSYTVVAPAAPPAPTPTPPAPATPATPVPGAPAPTTSSTLGQDAPANSSDRDGSTVAYPAGASELALAETGDRDDGIGTTAKVWGLVLLVLAAAGLAVCAVVVRRSEQEQL